MNLSTIVIIIYALGIIIGALFLDLWGAETSLSKAMAGGVSRSTIPAMAGLSVAITGTFASTFLKNKSKREEELLSEHLVSE